MNDNEKVFQCPECGLHYRDQATAQVCEEFCRANQACNPDIAKKAVEVKA